MLAEEGRAALHAIIGHTYNYRREVTERHVDKLPDSPMSCPKVRELHPQALAAGPCACRFDLRGRRATGGKGQESESGERRTDSGSPL